VREQPLEILGGNVTRIRVEEGAGAIGWGTRH
jgi:hypothetical protein